MTPEEIVNQKRQAWNKERTKKLGDEPKKYRAELRALPPAGLLRLHFTEEEDSHHTSIGPVLSDPGFGLRTLRVPGIDYAKISDVRPYLQVVCKGRGVRRLIRHRYVFVVRDLLVDVYPERDIGQKPVERLCHKNSKRTFGLVTLAVMLLGNPSSLPLKVAGRY